MRVASGSLGGTEARREEIAPTRDAEHLTILCLFDPSFNSANPVLRQKAAPVGNPSAPVVRDVVRDLADTLAHWRSETGYGRGIAAPQIGVLQRVIFLKLPGAEPWPLINPEIVERSEENIVVWDGCLSFLSIFMQVERHREITVRYQDLSGTEQCFTQATSGIFPNCCSMRSIISMGFWQSIA